MVPPLTARPLTQERWADLERFFGPRGAYGNCWCVFWRVTGTEFKAGCGRGGEGNRSLLHELSDTGHEPGLLGYEGDQPVGWVSVGPREDFGRVQRSPALRPRDSAEAGVWSVVCFWIPRRGRGRGVASALLAAAVSYAEKRGARVVEGYPVDTKGRPASVESLYTGTLDMFKRAGFTVARPTTGRRVVVQRCLT